VTPPREPYVSSEIRTELCACGRARKEKGRGRFRRRRVSLTLTEPFICLEFVSFRSRFFKRAETRGVAFLSDRSAQFDLVLRTSNPRHKSVCPERTNFLS
jgi:hypothetical protein